MEWVRSPAPPLPLRAQRDCQPGEWLKKVRNIKVIWTPLPPGEGQG